nr:glutathione S-transferase [Oceanococcus sp. HetDA_MAG_MS8]
MRPRPILYSFRRCPYAMRARLALAVAQIDLELREILLKDKPAAMLEASAKATVPVLVLPEGEVIDESLDVMHWALQQSDPQGWLHANDAATTQELLAINDGEFKHWLDRTKYSVRFPEHSMEHYRDQAMHILRDWNVRLEANGGALLGSQRRLVDWALLPFVRQFSMIDQQWFAQTPMPALQHWLQQGLATPLFGRIMTKYAPWQPEAGPGIDLNWGLES